MNRRAKNGIVVYRGDCLKILPRLNTTVQLVLTDPPFGINYQNNYTSQRHSKIQGDGQQFSYLTWARLCYPLIKQGGCVLAYTGWSEYPHHYRQLERAGFLMKEPLFVQKRASGKTDLYGAFQSNIDWLLFGAKGRFRFEKTKLLRNKRAGMIPNKGRKPVANFKTRFPSCWIGSEFPWSTENPKTEPHIRHPTKKTVELMKWIILLTTKPGDRVLDPFAGSGSVLEAARQTGRKAIGIEIDKEHYQTILDRTGLK